MRSAPNSSLSAWRRSLRRPAAMMRCPSAAKRRAMAAPKPAVAPVTNTIIQCLLGKQLRQAFRPQHVGYGTQALQHPVELRMVAYRRTHDNGGQAILRVGIGIDAVDTELLNRHDVGHVA